MVARAMVEMVNPDDRERVLVALEQVRHGAEVTGVILRVSDGGGRWRRTRWGFSQVSPALVTSGQPWVSGLSILAAGRELPGAWTAPVFRSDAGDELAHGVVATMPVAVTTKDAEEPPDFVDRASQRSLDTADPSDTVGRRSEDAGSGPARLAGPGRAVDDVPVSIQVAADVTDQAGAERDPREMEGILEAILSSCSDIVTIFDRQMQLVQDTAAATALLGLGRPMSVSESLERVHEEDRPRVVDAFEEVLAGVRREMTVRYRLRHADGGWITVDSTARTDLDEAGQVSSVVVLTRDVSEILATEARLRAALAVAEQTSQAQGELLSRVSHELRTPLNSILGFAQLLQMEQLPAHQAMLVDRVLRAGRRLLALVDEVLAVARLDAGHVELDPSEVLVADVFADVASVTGAVVEQAEMRADLVDDGTGRAGDVVVWADRRWLRHVLTSMVDVARQSVGAGVEHPVVLAVGHLDQDWAQLSIVPAIGERDVSADEHTAAVLDAGGGIGLARCGYLAEQMGGRLQPAVAGRGFELWVARAGSPSVVADPRPWPSPHGEHSQELTVVVVTDDRDVRELVGQLAERRPGVSAHAADTASWVGALPGSVVADVIVVDTTASGTLDVLAMLARWRQEERSTRAWSRGGSVQAVMAVLVSDARAESAEPYLAAGADACLAKPVDFRTLVELIDAARAVASGHAGAIGHRDAGEQRDG